MLVDATLVHMVLVLSIMKVLGPVNWLPGWMDRSMPRLGTEVTPTPLPTPA